MSEKFWNVPFKELKKVRIVCQHRVGEKQQCGTSIDIAIEKLESVTTCPICNNHIRPRRDAEDPFLLLARALKGFENTAVAAEMSFILPASE